jgi:UbiD family decarboxylase
MNADTGPVGFTDLQEFLTALDKDGDLARVSAPVDPDLEVSAIVARVLRERGPALLFERPTRGSMPLAINVFGTERRMARAGSRRWTRSVSASATCCAPNFRAASAACAMPWAR